MPARWSSEQLSNARVIMQVGRQLGASDRDILIGIMTAWQESNLRNLNYGDRDSIGLFQQRNAWAPGGSKSYRLNPYNAARMFFTGGHQDQRGLLDFKSRNSWSLTQAAQKVQVSAYPDAYAKWEDESRAMMGELGSSVGTPTPAQPESTDDLVPTDLIDLDGSPVIPEDPEKPAAAPAALGLESPVSEGTEAAGAESPGASGIESADEAPVFPELDLQDFLPASTGEPGGVAGSFEAMFPNNGPIGGVRQRVADIAKSALGVNYVWGGNDLQNGVDCSGLVQQVYKQLGINLPRISAAQARAGKRVGLDSLQVGDLVAWDNSSRNNGADHIAIYIGNGQIIEAPRPGMGVRIRKLGDSDRQEAWGVQMDI